MFCLLIGKHLPVRRFRLKFWQPRLRTPKSTPLIGLNLGRIFSMLFAPAQHCRFLPLLTPFTTGAGTILIPGFSTRTACGLRLLMAALIFWFCGLIQEGSSPRNWRNALLVISQLGTFLNSIGI